MRDEHGSESDAATRPSVRVAVDPRLPDPGLLGRAGEVIRNGGLVAFPTETVYGLGAYALDPVATAAIFEAKGRPSSDPLIVHVDSVGAARRLTYGWDGRVDGLARRFWPGPLTIVVSKARIVPDEITAGRPTVAIRIPAHPVALGLLAAADRPIAAPSANRFGRISPTTADAVEAELFGRYDLLLDGGPTRVGVESTVLDLTGQTPVVLRPGGVTVEELTEVLGRVEVRSGHSQSESVDAPAPGQFLRHYSPSTPLLAVRDGSVSVDEVVAEFATRGIEAVGVALPDEVDEAATELYRRMRSADGTADVIVVAMVDEGDIGRAVNDRLFRAARGMVVESLGDETWERLVTRLVGLRER